MANSTSLTQFTTQFKSNPSTAKSSPILSYKYASDHTLSPTQ